MTSWRLTPRRTGTPSQAVSAAIPGMTRIPMKRGRTQADEAAAWDVRAAAANLLGLGLLGRQISVPPTVASDYTDERWLELRLASARGLAVHHVLNAMRSSRAALIEHVAGTEVATAESGLRTGFKTQSTGDMLGQFDRLRAVGPPVIELGCDVPAWLRDEVAWRDACDRERDLYADILAAARRLSSAREERKAKLLADLSRDHERVIAFDRHPITLAAVKTKIPPLAAKVLVATGGNHGRREVERALAPESEVATVALCSDALNEGLNLQGASAIVHLDLPTTLRVAEQRVGRVDRMDSPHDVIAAWWPGDGEAFATRANELLMARAEESAALLGSNLRVPSFTADQGNVVNLHEHIDQLTRPGAETWDGIRDALDPVRQLITGTDRLVSEAEYRARRTTKERVMARVSPVRSTQPWAFFAVAGSSTGAPRWILLEGEPAEPTYGLDQVAARLRVHLEEDPESRAFDHECDRWLGRFLEAAGRFERQLLPRRMQRALEQMDRMTQHWAGASRDSLDVETAQRWEALNRLTHATNDDVQFDLYLVAERWLSLVKPALEAARHQRRRGRYLRLRHIEAQLRDAPLHLKEVERAFAGLPTTVPLANRVTACILGVPQSVS